MPDMVFKPNVLPDKNCYYNTVYEQILSSTTGAILTSLLVTPFDVVKTRLQVQVRSGTHSSGICTLVKKNFSQEICQNSEVFCCRVSKNKFNGTLDAFVKIPKQEGLRSLWSGLVPTMIISVPVNVMYFTMYDQLRQKLISNSFVPWNYIPIVSGISSRILAVTVVGPLEFLRTKVQSEKMKYSDAFDALSHLVKHRGFTSLWHGWVSTVYRDCTFSALYWSIYENLKTTESDPQFLESFLNGAISGAVSAVLTSPFDVIKTLKQSELGEQKLISGTKSPSTWILLFDLYRRDGVKSLFAGILPRTLKIAPACAIMISSYEVGKSYFKQKKME